MDAYLHRERIGDWSPIRCDTMAIEHTRQARTLAVERRDLMQVLINDGLSQSDIARELGVTRQAIQKVLAC